MGTERRRQSRERRRQKPWGRGALPVRELSGGSWALRPHPRLYGLREREACTVELVPKLPFAAVASSAAVFLKGTLAFRHEDAGRGAKSRLRIEEGAGLHDPAYVKLLYGTKWAPLRAPCIPDVPPGALALQTGEERPRGNC